MSETKIPEVQENASDVLEQKDSQTVESVEEQTVETPAAEAPAEEVAPAAEEKVEEAKTEEKAEQAEAPAEEKAEQKEAPAEEKAAEMPNFAEKTLAELTGLLDDLSKSIDKMKRSKEVEAIKSAFYKRLIKEKAEAGEISPTGDPDAEPEAAPAQARARSPFVAIEETFKGIYADYKKEKAEYNRQQDAEREANYIKKQAIVEELKALIDNQDDVSTNFPAFRDIQTRWKEVGPVPVQKFRNLNDSYQFQVERFYDMVRINHDLRDLDFKKNLEAKEAFCEAAEKLAENENVVDAFNELQKLHEQWKEFGPVAKEFRDSIWERFKAATAVINKRYQGHFEELKSKQADNLVAKQGLCEKVEEIAARDITSSSEWNNLTKEIEKIQAEWKTIGFASKKENQKIYDRFRSACDAFFAKKRAFYSEYKDSMNDNLEKKNAIVEAAEALKSSKEWKKATEEFIELQKKWKEIGAVPRKKSEQLWKRFRAACDEFFEERDKNAKPENDYYGNLRLKKKLIEEINAYASTGDAEADAKAYQEFSERWRGIGYVPFKEKDNIAAAYKEAVDAKFGAVARPVRSRGGERRQSVAPRSEKDILIQKYHALQQDIVTYENNIGFFNMSKNAEPLIAQMQQKIDDAKEELKKLESDIRNLEEKEQDNG